MIPFRPILDRLRRNALRGLSGPDLFTCYQETRDEAAMEELHERSTPRLRAQCRPYLQDRDEIDEVVQEVFRLLVERADTILNVKGIELWLDQAAINVARNRSRRQSRMPRPLLPDDLAAADQKPGPDLLAELREKYAHVLTAIELLKEDWKRALKLKLLEERPYSEVAELLGSSLDKVKQDVSRARKELRRLLTKKGIVLPAALASVLLGGRVQARTQVLVLALLATAITLGMVVVAAVRTFEQPEGQPTRPLMSTPAPIDVAKPLIAEEVVLNRVLSLLDNLTELKTKQTVLEEGPRRVRWRMNWVPDPDRHPQRPVRWSAFVDQHSYLDLVFDRWTGRLDMLLAVDGKNATSIDPRQPIITGPGLCRAITFPMPEMADGKNINTPSDPVIIIGLPGFPEWVMLIPIPELAEVAKLFEQMVLTTVPAHRRSGPLHPEPLPPVLGHDGQLHIGRAEPDQVVMIRLQPGHLLTATRRPGLGELLTIVVWRPGCNSAIQSLQLGVGPWNYRNESNVSEELVFAGISGKSGKWLTCQPRLTSRDDGTCVLDFDEDYLGRFEDARLEVVVK